MRIITILLCLLAVCPAAWAAGDQFNPQPAPGDLVLPLPKGGSIVFRPVFIGQGAAPFAQAQFKMGDPSGGFKEFPTKVTVGGAFIGQNKGREDWLYYLGKYEVSEGQYYQVMGLPQGGDPKLLDSRYPIRNISRFQAQAFIDKLNQWLFQNALDKLPDYNGAVGFIRLPTEIEWAFAARGGAAVSADVFDQRTPYSDSLAKHEWFAGPKSSHDKVKKIGLLEPNPVLLHDMLGNVAEMTSSPYQVEYYQGRYGGFVSRGGHYLTSQKKMRSSLRTEEPYYRGSKKRGFKPNAKQTLGFRLALSSVVYANRNTIRELAGAWDDYRGGKGADTPAAVSVKPTTAQTKVHSQDAFVYLARLKKLLDEAGLTQKAQTELGLLEASLGNIEFIRKKADLDSAYAWSKIAAERGFFIFRELRKIPTMERLRAIAQKTGRTAMVEKYDLRLADMRKNVTDALSTYSDSLRQLTAVEAQAVAQGFEKYHQFLMEHQAAAQLRLLKVVKDHFAAFARTQRADPDKWRADFTAFGKTG